ncbi:MAG: hypothetical protein K8F30_00940, partial [Taibaiella sp.]|nr:hypothetical protein [Taibaiella sp.]
MFVTVFAGCSREKPGVSVPTEGKGVLAPTTVLATIAHDENPPQAVPGHGTAPEVQKQPAFELIFSESGRGVAYTVEKNNKHNVVHNNIRGKEYDAVGQAVLSPDGARAAYAALTGKKWRMVVDGKEGRPYDVLLTPVFSPDSQHIVYQAKHGDTWYVVVDDKQNAGTKASYTTPEFNFDSTMIAFVEAAASSSDMKLIVSDLKFSKQSIKRSIGDLLFTTNKDKTKIAAAQAVNDKFRVIDFDFAKPEVVHE